MIKRASVSDIPKMLNISQNVFVMGWGQAEFESEMQKSYVHAYLCTQNECSVGYIVVWDLYGEGEIVTFAVDGDWRNHGIGTALLNHVFNKHDSVKTWHLEVDFANLAAVHLYEKCSFKSNRLIKDYYGQGKNAIHMSRCTGLPELINR